MIRREVDMRVSEAFPSRFLKPEDVGTKRPRLVIREVTRERIGDDVKLVAWFEGTHRGLALNKTNASAIARALGDETDGWVGQTITLMVTNVDYRGQTVPAIRVHQVEPVKRGPADPFADDGDGIGF